MNNFITKWKEGLAKTSKATFSRINTLLATSKVNQNIFDELESILIQADLGIGTCEELINALQERERKGNINSTDDLKSKLREELHARISEPPEIFFYDKPSVILIVGVNGSGKTTTIAKLGRYYQAQGKHVILGAADTFRAAAIDQLQIWADRLDLPIISGQSGGDTGAVAYDTVQSAIAKKADIVIIDTAGRLHTRYNLMEEIKKVQRVIARTLPGAPHAVWLVLDATTGQNALLQSRAFMRSVSVTGIILAKLDSSARGGMVFAIQRELGLPILFVGLGEKPEDLLPFNPDAFIDGILGEN